MLRHRVMKFALALMTVASSVGLGFSSSLWAGARIETPGTPFMLSFDESLPDVITYSADNAYSPALAEPGEFHLEKGSSMRLNSRSFSLQRPSRDIGRGPGVPTAFGEDLDGDGTTGKTLNASVAGLSFARGWGNRAAGVLAEDGTALLIGTGRASPHQTYLNPILRIENATGAPLNRWQLDLKVWFADSDDVPASLEISYSTDGETFTTITTLTSHKTTPTGEEFDSANPGHWSSENPIATSFEAPVNPSEFLYLKLKRSEDPGSAADFLIDDLIVTGEP